MEQFGNRFGSRLKQEMEAVGIWKTGELVRIPYRDRYLNAPLPMLLLLRTCAYLATNLQTRGCELDIIVQPLKQDQDRTPFRILHDWQNEDDRADVAYILGDILGLDVDVQLADDPGHGCKLELEYADGQKAIVLLDQGFGYWRISGPAPKHDFRAEPKLQANRLCTSIASVSGFGESYFAVTSQ